MFLFSFFFFLVYDFRFEITRQSLLRDCLFSEWAPSGDVALPGPLSSDAIFTTPCGAPPTAVYQQCMPAPPRLGPWGPRRNNWGPSVTVGAVDRLTRGARVWVGVPGSH